MILARPRYRATAVAAVVIAFLAPVAVTVTASPASAAPTCQEMYRQRDQLNGRLSQLLAQKTRLTNIKRNWGSSAGVSNYHAFLKAKDRAGSLQARADWHDRVNSEIAELSSQIHDGRIKRLDNTAAIVVCGPR